MTTHLHEYSYTTASPYDLMICEVENFRLYRSEQTNKRHHSSSTIAPSPSTKDSTTTGSINGFLHRPFIDMNLGHTLKYQNSAANVSHG
jgi:hypothetical protein